MVAVLISAAVVMPSPKGTSTAQASFKPISHKIDQAGRHLGVADASNDRDESARYVDVASTREFDILGYDLDAVISGQDDVPRIKLDSVPVDISRIRETDVRKSMFFKTVLPLVLQVNEQILQDRQRLWNINVAKRAGAPIEAVDRLWLVVMAERYGTRRGDVDALLKRHDIVPPSLALAQAATESAWGTSRFVKEGNAIFGQYTFVDDHSGLVPSDRQDGKTHRIKAFNSLYDSVASYVNNLNTHQAYSEFRTLRAEMRARGQNLDGRRLATTLHRYSERGEDYVADIHAIMSGNALVLLDSARLSQVGMSDPIS